MVSKEVYLFKPHDTVTDEVGKKEMIDLYKNKLACQGQPARAYYDRIIMSAPKWYLSSVRNRDGGNA